jgi:hypothetical protein
MGRSRAESEKLSSEDEALLEAELRAQLGIYFRHVVGLAGVYEHIGDDGTQRPQIPFYFSAVILEIDNCWYLATAGHIVEKLNAAATRKDMRLVAVDIEDSFAPKARYNHPIKYFAYQDANKFCRHEEGGLDCGLIELRQNYRDLLTANGVQPLVERHWNPSQVARCNTFLMLGFPQDSVVASITDGRKQYLAAVRATPSVVWVERSKTRRKGTRSAACTRFVGKVGDEKQVGNIVGMSGGPIFCFRGTNFENYFVAGIQSSWDPESRLTFACAIPDVLTAARDFLANQEH